MAAVATAASSLHELRWQRATTPGGLTHYEEALLGDFEGGDGVRFTLEYRATCYRRGPWRLLVEVATGEHHFDWGCFDDQDQPLRYYHHEGSARVEAQTLANVLWADRRARDQ